jgi:hypothetical protein
MDNLITEKMYSFARKHNVKTLWINNYKVIYPKYPYCDFTGNKYVISIKDDKGNEINPSDSGSNSTWWEIIEMRTFLYGQEQQPN